jgi:Uma2 family endonuclease
MATQATPRRTGAERKHMTYEEYRAWADEDVHGEWVDGEVIELTTVKGRHALVFGFLFELIRRFVRLRQLGLVLSEPFEMRILGGRAARLPDIFVVLKKHVDRYSDERLEGPADLVVEIVSESSVTEDLQVKRREYETAGVPEYWLVEGRLGRSGFEMLCLNAEGAYEPVQPDHEGRNWSRALPGLWVDPTWFADERLPDPDTVLNEMTASR